MKSRKSNRSQNRSREERGGEDIVKLILDDHKELKKLIKVMKDDEEEMDEKREAFDQFATLLLAHAKPEEEVLYSHLKNIDDLRWEGFEGEVEHQLADQLVEETKRTDDEDELCARIKVLAELVEHHIEEEEDEMLPDFKKYSDKEERRVLGLDFLNLKSQIQENGEFESEHEEDYGEQYWRQAR
jgi:hemerythrin superfamily protein